MNLYQQTRKRHTEGRSGGIDVVETRVIDVPDGETPPPDSVPAPKGSKVFDWVVQEDK